MTTDLIHLLCQRVPVLDARGLFAKHRESLNAIAQRTHAESVSDDSWARRVEQAAADLASWARSTGRQQNYTPEELAMARHVRESANQYEAVMGMELDMINCVHQAYIGRAFYGGLASDLIQEGKRGRKLALIDLSARLSPVLTFPGSSEYFYGVIGPYGKETRIAIGENVRSHYVSAQAAQESAKNLARLFGSHYVIAETSAAPRNDVPKARRSPEVFICSIAGDAITQFHEVIETPFRSEFNAVVRQMMFESLKMMYGGCQ